MFMTDPILRAFNKLDQRLQGRLVDLISSACIGYECFSTHIESLARLLSDDGFIYY